jgi:hypothetical protein
LAALSVAELIPRLNPADEFGPGMTAPEHLPWLLEQLEQAIAPHAGHLYRWFSVPPGHWKTTTLVHALVKHLVCWPTQLCYFGTHSDDFARKISRQVRKLVQRAGLRISRKVDRQDEWELETGGGLLAKSINAGISGRRFRFGVVDDPFANRQDAQSKARREVVAQAIDGDVAPRLTSEGALFLVHTRWHPDDAIGRVKKRANWQGLNMPALRMEGGQEHALLPSQWPVAHLDAIRRANALNFSALYQGEPILAGQALFKEPTRYEWPDARPRAGYRVAYGVDLAYSSRTVGDWSVILRLLAVDTGNEELDPETKQRRKIIHYYVTDVVRKHVDAPSFALAIKTSYCGDPGPIRWDRNTVEEGSAQFIKDKLSEHGIRPDHFRDVLAKGQPYDRCQRVAEAWNLGRVLVPGGPDAPAWVEDFVDELTTMTGVKDPHDDQAVALASAFEILRANPEPANFIRVKSSWT